MRKGFRLAKPGDQVAKSGNGVLHSTEEPRDARHELLRVIDGQGLLNQTIGSLFTRPPGMLDNLATGRGSSASLTLTASEIEASGKDPKAPSQPSPPSTRGSCRVENNGKRAFTIDENLNNVATKKKGGRLKSK